VTLVTTREVGIGCSLFDFTSTTHRTRFSESLHSRSEFSREDLRDGHRSRGPRAQIQRRTKGSGAGELVLWLGADPAYGAGVAEALARFG
jgi:hypothetical protein